MDFMCLYDNTRITACREDEDISIRMYNGGFTGQVYLTDKMAKMLAEDILRIIKESK